MLSRANDRLETLKRKGTLAEWSKALESGCELNLVRKGVRSNRTSVSIFRILPFDYVMNGISQNSHGSLWSFNLSPREQATSVKKH
jgi:hypothetical protein